MAGRAFTLTAMVVASAKPVCLVSPTSRCGNGGSLELDDDERMSSASGFSYNPARKSVGFSPSLAIGLAGFLVFSSRIWAASGN